MAGHGNPILPSRNQLPDRCVPWEAAILEDSCSLRWIWWRVLCVKRGRVVEQPLLTHRQITFPGWVVYKYLTSGRWFRLLIFECMCLYNSHLGQGDVSADSACAGRMSRTTLQPHWTCQYGITGDFPLSSGTLPPTLRGWERWTWWSPHACDTEVMPERQWPET